SEALETLQRLLSEPTLASAEIVWVTRGVWDDVQNVSPAAVWGLVRTAASEHSERTLRRIDAGPGAMDGKLLARALGTSGEPELVLRDGAAQAPRLVRARGAAAEAARGSELTRGTTLITGGTGELGQALSRHLVKAHGVRH